MLLFAELAHAYVEERDARRQREMEGARAAEEAAARASTAGKRALAAMQEGAEQRVAAKLQVGGGCAPPTNQG